MNGKSARQLSYVIAFLVGILPAFFIVFNAIFSDVFSTADRVMTFLLVAVAYTALGALFGFFAPMAAWQVGLWLSLPAILIVAWYSTREPGQWLLHLTYLILTLAFASLGAYVGSRLGERRRKR
jgi:hypothetical protein